MTTVQDHTTLTTERGDIEEDTDIKNTTTTTTSTPELPAELIDKLVANLDGQDLELLGAGGALAALNQAVINRTLGAELTAHLGYEAHDPVGNNSGNSRNGASSKKVITDYGEIDIAVPRDRNGDFEPVLVPKGSKRLDGFNQRVIDLYAGGMTTRDIRRHIAKIYGLDISADLVSTITDEILDELKDWQNRPLESCYPIMYIDALVVKVRDGGTVINKAAYVAVGVDVEGRKHVLGIWIGDGDEGAKYWSVVLGELARRGIADVLIVCCYADVGIGAATGSKGSPMRSKRPGPERSCRPV